MTAAPRLSVVMPVHNGMPFVDESLASIAAQRLADFELVIGDDGSNDGTSEILKDWARRDLRIRIVRRERKSGLAASANWVVSMARAPIVAIAHADDVYHPDRLGRQLSLLDAHPDVAAIGTLALGIDASGRRVHPPSYWGLISRSPFAAFTHSSIMMRRASFDLAGGYRAEAEYWEDLDLYWRLLRTGRILVIPQALASYRYSAVSDRSRVEAAEVENALEIMYAAAALHWHGRNVDALFRVGNSAVEPGRIRPKIFIARCWTDIWSGQRPRVLRRLLARGDLRFDLTSLAALAFVGCATLTPRLAGLIVRGLMLARNVVARWAIGNRPYVEWRPWQEGARTAPPVAAKSVEPVDLAAVHQG